MSTRLTVLNSGPASFEVTYDRVPPEGVVPFPFLASPEDQLQVTGAGGVRTFAYRQPVVDLMSMVGKRVRITYGQDLAASKDVLTDEGVLVRADMAVCTIELARGGLLSISPMRISTIVCDDATSVPGLLVTVTDLEKPLRVRGTDGQFSFSAHHALIVEPSTSARHGEAMARLTSFVSVHNNYTVDVPVDQLTLTEIELPQRQYEKTAAPRAAMMAAPADTVSDEGSKQVGSITLNRAVTLRRSQTTSIALGERVVPDASVYFLCTLDPVVGINADAPVDTIVRMKQPSDDFLFSGPMSVTVDMDPAPGEDHVAGPVVGSIFYDGLARKKSRLYHNLGDTNLVKLCVKRAYADDRHDETKNEHHTTARLQYSNRTPYPTLVKHYLKTSRDNLITHVVAKPSKSLTSVLDDGFIPEQDTDFIDKLARTLVVVVPAGAVEAELVLAIDYSRVL